ncbi:MAG: ribonuclease E inhibitor RraB [Polyangiaceae bacterium]
METRSVASSLSGVSLKVSVGIAAERAPIASHALRVQIRASLPGAKVSSRDQETARSYEDAIVAAVHGRLGGLYGGWHLVERAAVFQFFLPTALENESDSLLQVVEGLLSERGALLAPATRVATDTTEPRAAERAREEVLHVVEHTAFFTNITRAALASSELIAAGFQVEAPFVCRVVDELSPTGVLRHCVRATRAESLSRTRIDDFTREIRGIIHAHAGEYDGWTSAARPPVQLRAARLQAPKKTRAA